VLPLELHAQHSDADVKCLHKDAQLHHTAMIVRKLEATLRVPSMRSILKISVSKASAHAFSSVILVEE
jgi:hypothetical protein